jgi:hypothetical protein
MYSSQHFRDRTTLDLSKRYSVPIHIASRQPGLLACTPPNTAVPPSVSEHKPERPNMLADENGKPPLARPIPTRSMPYRNLQSGGLAPGYSHFEPLQTAFDGRPSLFKNQNLSDSSMHLDSK